MIVSALKSLKQSVVYASLKKLTKDWKVFKKLVKRALNNNDLNESFRLLEGMGTFGWKFNFLNFFSDDDVERLIYELTSKINIQIPYYNTNSSKVVFYDYFTLENRGFTQQYLDVIKLNGLELLYITTKESKDIEDNYIVNFIKNYDKAKLYILPNIINKPAQLNSLVNEISNFKASKVFIHSAPWDILACCLATKLKETLTKTYLINITDHTFWPGKNAFDYFIDFRHYGSSINKYYRNIDENKIILIPTPPYLQTDELFNGFPIDVSGKVVGFAGGTIYKIIDEKNTFLELIKDLLNKNSNFIFLFANIGGDEYLNRFIIENQLENRFVLIGNRRDINEVFKRIDIFFNTYPYGGGLMIQYAIANRKPIVALWDDKIIYTRIDKVIDKDLDERYLITSVKDFNNIANKIINDEEYRLLYTNGLVDNVDLSKVFFDKLTNLLLDQLSSHDNIKKEAIDFNAIAEFHINNDNLYFFDYLHFKNRYLGKSSILYKVFSLKLPNLVNRIIS